MCSLPRALLERVGLSLCVSLSCVYINKYMWVCSHLETIGGSYNLTAESASVFQSSVVLNKHLQERVACFSTIGCLTSHFEVRQENKWI